jgi:hypothetical protein
MSARSSMGETDACMPGMFILWTDLAQIYMSVFMPNELHVLLNEFILHQCLQLSSMNTALYLLNLFADSVTATQYFVITDVSKTVVKQTDDRNCLRLRCIHEWFISLL